MRKLKIQIKGPGKKSDFFRRNNFLRLNFYSKAALLSVFLSIGTIGCTAGGSDIKVSANPALPVENFVNNGSFEYCEEDYEGFDNRDPSGFAFSMSSDACSGKKALKVEKPVHGAILCRDAYPPAGTYIASIMVKPEEGTKNLGMRWIVNYKLAGKKIGNSENAFVDYDPAFKGQWRKAVTNPVTIPENADGSARGKGYWRFDIGLFSETGSGLVDDVCISTAYTDLTVEVENTKGIKRVTVTDDTGKSVIDSGALENTPKKWKKTEKVLTLYIYTVSVTAADGTVTKKSYPEKKKK